MNDCNICNELKKGNHDFESSVYQEMVLNSVNILIESEFFCVIPSFGPLDNSHVLIVPKRHVNSFAALSPSEIVDSEKILLLLNDYYESHYDKKLIFFESGAGSIVDHSGGCITHAHIHCVVHSQEFEDRLFEEIDFVKSQNNEYTDFDIQHGYVWYKNSQGEVFFRNRPLLPSQFLRYLYCEYKHECIRWNWRRDINVNGIIKVIETYSGIKALKGSDSF